MLLSAGAGGSGKSFVTKHLTHSLRAMGKDVMLAATTGAAAQRLSAYAGTVHSKLKISPKSVYVAALTPNSNVMHALLDNDVLVRLLLIPNAHSYIACLLMALGQQHPSDISFLLPIKNPLFSNVISNITIVIPSMQIIDEYSMMSFKFWYVVLGRLVMTNNLKGATTIEELLKTKLIILVGDHMQVKTSFCKDSSLTYHGNKCRQRLT